MDDNVKKIGFRTIRDKQSLTDSAIQELFTKVEQYEHRHLERSKQIELLEQEIAELKELILSHLES